MILSDFDSDWFIGGGGGGIALKAGFDKINKNMFDNTPGFMKTAPSVYTL